MRERSYASSLGALQPLTPGQLAIWAAQAFDWEDPLYNMGGYVNIVGGLDPDRFERALRQAVEEADSLHLRFVETDQGPRQHIVSDRNWTLYRLDFGAEPDPQAAAEAWMRADLSRAVDLVRGPAFRYALIRLGDQLHWAYGVNHHLVNDAFGFRLLNERVASLYSDMARGLTPPFERFGSIFDLASAEETYRAGARFARDRAYWLDRLRDAPLVSLSPYGPEAASNRVATIVGRVAESPDSGRRRSAEGAVSPAVFTAAVALYLHLVTGATDIVLGFLVSARLGDTALRSVGLAANTLPLRLTVDPSETFATLTERTARCIREALRHQLYRLEDLRRDLGLTPGDPDPFGAVVDVFPLDQPLEFAESRGYQHSYGNWRAADALFVWYGLSADAGPWFELVANDGRYSQEAAARHANAFRALLEACRSNSGRLCVMLGEVGAVDRVRPGLHAPAPAGHPAYDALAETARLRSRAEAPHTSEPPQTPSERAVARIWGEVLRRGDFGRSDDFFDLGGHSLLATQVRSRVNAEFGVDLPLRVAFEARSLAAFARAIDEARAKASRPAAPRSIKPLAPRDFFVLSHSQERMWLMQALDPGSAAYTIAILLRLSGRLNVSALGEALNVLLRRHEALRTTFVVKEGEVFQRIEPWREMPLEALDLRAFGEGAPDEAIRRSERDARTPFDLEHGPVVRVALFQTGDEEHFLHFALHHISADQWSVGVIGREMAAAYNAILAGRPPDLGPAPLNYSDFASWRRDHLQDEEADRQLAYWARKLDGLKPLNLPTDFARPRVRTAAGSAVVVPLPAPLLARLEQLSLREGCTLFMTMLAVYAVHLRRLTGQTDLAIGVPIANRTRADVESIIGVFVNTLALRIDLSGRPSFGALLARVRDTALEAYANQDLSFDRLVRSMKRPRDDSRAPIVQTMFNMMNAPFHGVEFDGLTWKPVFIDRRGAQFELSVSVDPQVTCEIGFEFNTDLFRRDTIERFADQYLHLLDSVAADPEASIETLPMLPPAELRLLLDEWNDTSTNDAEGPTFIQSFEARAARDPGREAVEFRQERMSYGELDRRAEGLAQRLRALGVAPGVGVAISLERSPTLIAALLGVQKAGGFYVPVDPTLPRKRREYMLADSHAKVLVVSRETLADVALPEGVTALDADETSGESSAPPCPGRAAAPDDPAYVIYTSGSTGQPKGVCVPHRALTNFLRAMSRAPGLHARDVLAAVTTISFDIAGLEIYLPLFVGARIVLAPSETAADGSALAALLERSGATVLQATPATWRMVVDAGWRGGQHIRGFCGGEALSRDLADAILPRVGKLWNLYGPTETTIWSTVARVVPGDAPISVGRPIDNTRVYVVDAACELAPIGVAGEILIGGAGVADGYHNRPELTAERFLPDPFAKERDAYLYRTGDLGRWGADGLLYHLGRSDDQVKVRGFRIELGEIEAALRAHPAVREAVVTARDFGDGDARLMACVLPRSGMDVISSELRESLRGELPNYMVPSTFVTIEGDLPLTPNGKVDRKALSERFAAEPPAPKARLSPAPGLEQAIAGVWRDLLKIKDIGAEDNFFELGGHSLLALRAASLIAKQTGRKIDPRTFYFQSLRQIAASAAGLAASKISPP